MLDSLLFVVLAVEGHADAYTSVVLYAFSSFIIIGVLTSPLVGLSLDDKTAAASGYQTLEDRCELLGDLLECPLNGFILALIQDFNKLRNRRLGVVKFLSSLGEGVSLGSKVVVLFEGFLVNSHILLESFVNFLESGLDLQSISKMTPEVIRCTYLV